MLTGSSDHPTIDFEPDKGHEKYLIPSLTCKSGMNWKIEMNISFQGMFVEIKETQNKNTSVFCVRILNVKTYHPFSKNLFMGRAVPL